MTVHETARTNEREASREPRSSEDSQTGLGRRRSVIAVAVALGVIVLLVGSILTSRSGLLGREPASTATPVAAKTGDPNAVAAPDTKLLRIETPPNQTRTQIRLAKDIGKPVFGVAFEPYGLGSGNTAVIRLTKVSAEGGTPLAADFAKALVRENLQVLLGTDDASALKTGGAYVGKISLVTRAGVTSFALSGVQRSK